MTKSKVTQASEKVRVLDKETQDTLQAVRSKNTKAVIFFIISWSVLLCVGIYGIYRQNVLAEKNQAHIDCIIKLFATPTKPGQSRHITDLATCNIKVN